MNKLNSLEFKTSLEELKEIELLEIDGGIIPPAILVIGAIGGTITATNELWKFSGGIVQGFKDGFYGR
ncbi:class IIb bacteriocin, lactobin A/cerein 7B family [Metasolibacillus meyeri]|uniref:Class IIb bacteriocin, lactobin A/cerein 7B family n=1 Tax=Metasolibacillus meyeri TaxID=1071052 RepID=A0AAW9NVD6_9BACL|nr:class IIb bacteriocin, lactobin A/cerein 7B family [Metasolibacillus meyeri]MEC1180253.1 class IIb bacteriocin, lactobin A/cerein 7B family [Metasolibacillus meyeri]